MNWEWFEAYRHFLPAPVLLLSVGLTLGLSRRSRRVWLAAIVGGLTPPLLLLAGFLIWDAQQPYGGFLTLIGGVLAFQALLFGGLGAAAAALYRVLRRELAAE